MLHSSLPPELILLILSHCPSLDISRWIRWYQRSDKTDSLLRYLQDPSLPIHGKLVVRRHVPPAELTFYRSHLGVALLHSFVWKLNLQGLSLDSTTDELKNYLVVCGRRLIELDVGNGPNATFTNETLRMISQTCPNLRVFKCSALLTQFKSEASYDDRGILELVKALEHLEELDMSHHLRPKSRHTPRITIQALINAAQMSKSLRIINAHRCFGLSKLHGVPVHDQASLGRVITTNNASGTTIDIIISKEFNMRNTETR